MSNARMQNACARTVVPMWNSLQHPLCAGQVQRPCLKVAYTRQHLVELERQCEAYRSKVVGCSREMAEEVRLKVSGVGGQLLFGLLWFVRVQRVAREERDQLVVIQARQKARRERERVRGEGYYVAIC